MATTRFIDHLLEGDHASRPAAGDVPEGTLYSCTTHSLVYQSDTSTWSTWATLGGGSSDLDAIIAASSGQNIADALAGAASPAAGNVFATMADIGGGGSDPIADMFGTPDTAFEFDTSSFTGLTSLGTLASEDADTTVPDHYYVRNTQNGNPYVGGRYASVTSPFTAICQVYAAFSRNYHSAGLFMGQATPASNPFEMLLHGYMGGGVDGAVHVQRWNSEGSFSGQIYNGTAARSGPIYLGIRANSTSSVDYLYSNDGLVWHEILAARNPSFTIANIGCVAVAQESTFGSYAIFDFLRIWNSAKTFVGG